MSTLAVRGGEEWSERSATKRSASPGGKMGEAEAKKNRSRRHKGETMLVVLQRGVLRREGEELARLHSAESESDLIGSFGQTSSVADTVVGRCEVARHNSLPTPTLAMVETEILGSLDSCSGEVATSPLDWVLSASCLWSRTSSPGCSSRTSFCLPTEELYAHLSCSRRPSLASYSSSYTSWTQPVVGRQQSDSCVPPSSILDMLEEAILEGRSRSRPGAQHRTRDRSADTSKDISEIDDFELDLLEDELELPHDDEDSVKGQGWMVMSPDLAYCSMEPSHHSPPPPPQLYHHSPPQQPFHHSQPKPTHHVPPPQQQAFHHSGASRILS